MCIFVGAGNALMFVLIHVASYAGVYACTYGCVSCEYILRLASG